MFFDRCYFCVSMLAALLESIVFHVLSSPRGAETIFVPFYRHRAAREQYFRHFIVTVQRGNNIFAILSSPCGAGTIFLPFYRRRAARERYFCHFIVTARRGNDILIICYRADTTTIYTTSVAYWTYFPSVHRHTKSLYSATSRKRCPIEAILA